MKKNIIVISLTFILGLASCSFTSSNFDQTDKDKLLLQLISYVLDQGHFVKKEINDDFSSKVFNEYLNIIDPYKRYFYKSDIEEFKKYEDQLDDKFINAEIDFFDLTYNRGQKRFNESKLIYEEILDTPFDYQIDENFNADFESLDYVKNKSEMKDRWRKQLKFSSIEIYDNLLEEQEKELEDDPSYVKKSNSEIESESRESTLKTLNEMYDFYEDITRSDWFSFYINSFVEQYDPHTIYYSPEAKDRFDVDMSGNYAGIGARLVKKLDRIEVVEVISGGPAWRQNLLEVGDIILKVRQNDQDESESTSILGMPISDAVKLIKGPKGTNVILTIKKVDGEVVDLKIKRDIVLLEETYVRSSIVSKHENLYGFINLPKFYIDFDNSTSRDAAKDIKKEIIRLKNLGVKGLVLDLRNNGGGSLKTVVEMAGLFIQEGPIVQVRSMDKESKILRDKDRSIIWEGPLVILVNEFSASASEILAAAMQDYKRAIIIGSKQTYGKGTVQNVLDLNRMVKSNTNGDLGALKFTTQKYYRINGGSTQLEGVKSDIVVPDKYTYVDFGEKDQENPLEWDMIEPVSYEPWKSLFDYNKTIDASKNRMKSSEFIRLIDENAKWIKSIRDRDIYTLNYSKFKKDLLLNEEKAKKYKKLSDYSSDLTFKSLPYEIDLIAKDSSLGEKRKRWHKNLSKDIYVNESLNVLNDLRLSYVER
ncbi:MAG: carboxy terminal-processing peptidase [Flavobacteriaceae bacterium]|mgnify:FL=1|jgi:carboxyl-terminal processing protease|nr:carboxy terminal-processing peptidase [Flavobacteriaceae bacterium]MBT4113557.1 carboxy terminal-processing peptidase [Flavobacteriaceae bacterium]MBT4614788.1 carboxy terminal-processing peptidase [Flavobacteriaceae bacterium]MBT5246551.1 carboxy terminal-processing peptidase [Flavobacteriaceae bacterium]MBT5649818.1 carboxy terminal-processing peptidase [Flavobacteriaceae bacterium]